MQRMIVMPEDDYEKAMKVITTCIAKLGNCNGEDTLEAYHRVAYEVIDYLEYAQLCLGED